ncbi:MAG TPA: hypothetical protein PLO17_19515 [Alcaligenes phenolicus]|uniref:hypothetical protein n=1 Tax=Alcaligenes phenolicus TaxID=232846 RepID=UPI002B6A66A8|nr:hypothetical protein [Alcaligenes phenolicus]HRO22579.1 hypothetical protein [Alcaligenes phenolicus]
MASWQLKLQPPPKKPRAFELWLQHAAGRILVEDVRAYAIENIKSGLSEEARAAAEKGIDDALYGLMMVIDGVSGTLANETQHVELSVQVRLVTHEPPAVAAAIDLREGEGMCMGYHGWLEGDFGESPVAVPKP